MKTSLLFRFAALAAVCVLVVGACSGDDVTTTTGAPVATTTSGGGGSDDVVFGSGSVPDTLPDDFPVPEQAVISSTLVVRSNSRTEMILRIPASLEASVQYYQVNLEARGYSVDASAARDDGRWEMELSRESLSGDIRFTSLGSDVTEAVMQFEG